MSGELGWEPRHSFECLAGAGLPCPQLSRKVLLCTVTAIGLVRLACQPKLMGSAVQTIKDSLLDALT
jgi:hypothetical protein